jgi:hypothetical protein
LVYGRYSVAVARMERLGIPVNAGLYARIREHQGGIVDRLTAEVDRDYGVFRPVGTVLVDPRTPFGAAVINTAREYRLCPYRLGEVATSFYHEERDSKGPLVEARKAARKETGLTAHRMNRMIDGGQDHTNIPGFDLLSRELAHTYPALAIGSGYTGEGGEDKTDYAQALWDTLLEHDEELPRRDDPDLLRRAADYLESLPDRGFDPRPMSWNNRLFAHYVRRRGFDWPRKKSGALDQDKETFKAMGERYPEVEPLRELRKIRSLLRKRDGDDKKGLPIGRDGRCRAALMPFASKSSRNQPSNNFFVFGLPAAFRSLIRPEPGWALAYLDWAAQEFAIAAVLSGDQNMIADYGFGDPGGDPYCAFGVRAGLLPAGATKQTHGGQREQLKTACGLGSMYGAGAKTVSGRLGIGADKARRILLLHRQHYARFWRWSDSVLRHARARCWIASRHGWRMQVRYNTGERTIRNFPMQSVGADLMRWAACLATEAGIRVLCPIHDAFLIEAREEDIDCEAARMQAIMREAGETILKGYQLRTDAKVIRPPDCYRDRRGADMWQTLLEKLAEEEGRAAAVPRWDGAEGTFWDVKEW